MNETHPLFAISGRKGHPVRAATSIGAAVLLALYGPLQRVVAQAVTGELEEITVTATRRTSTLESVPYAISAVSAEALAAANVTDIATLTEAVPGLSTYNFGTRLAGSEAPNIRGINASGSPRGFRTFEQDPVGTYIGNSPISGYFQLNDIRQVEVLRGPQGTLYGAGSLGGALRLIPNSPELNKFTGSVDVSGGKLDHSNQPAFAYSGLLNLPIGDTLAFRASGKYSYDPGFISVFGLLRRNNDTLLGVPELADPSDPVNSPPIYNSVNDWNWQRTVTGRTSLLWKPSDVFSVEAADLYSNVWGDGGPSVNFNYPGGVSPIDSTETLSPGGHYREFSQIDQPWKRTTNLTSLDMSLDAGFATLSATSTYQSTTGSTILDQSYSLLGIFGGFLAQYYSGVPQNPRFESGQEFADSSFTYSQEVRLVSKAGPDDKIDYVVGLFFQDSHRNGVWTIGNPGSPERSVAQGCTSPVFAGSSFPNCLVVSGPNDLTFYQIDDQVFVDKSIFSDVTWHFMPNGQLTVGARHFNQQFTDLQNYQLYTFPTYVPPIPHSSPAGKTVWKVNPSFEYATQQYVYALWSQGFRRGGANGLPETGFYQESPLIRYYQPDTTNNYEIGLKGRFDNGLSYRFSVYDIRWNKPQISASLPDGNLAVYNANTADSKGFELETSGPMPLTGLTYDLAYSYIDAELSSDFSLPGNISGVITPGVIAGTKGQQLPGSSKSSVNATLNYDVKLSPSYELLLSLNGNYHSSIPFSVAPVLGAADQKSSSYETLNFTATVNHEGWRWAAYVTNLTDRQNVLAPPVLPNILNGLTNDTLVSRPREVGLRIGYTF